MAGVVIAELGRRGKRHVFSVLKENTYSESTLIVSSDGSRVMMNLEMDKAAINLLRSTIAQGTKIGTWNGWPADGRISGDLYTWIDHPFPTAPVELYGQKMLALCFTLNFVQAREFVLRFQE